MSNQYAYVGARYSAKDPMGDFYIDVPESQIVKYTNPAVVEPTSECFIGQERPGSVNKPSLLSFIGSSNSSVGGRSTKTIVTGGHPFVGFATADDYNKITSVFNTWVTTGLRTKRKGCVYAKKDNVLQPPFEFGVMHVHKKEWFHQLAYKGQPLNDTHVDFLFYYLRKKGKYDPDVTVKFTTTDYLFDLKIKALHKKFIGQNRDVFVLNPDHDVAQYILGNLMLCNRLWHTVDHILFPILASMDNWHWVLAILSFKGRCIYLYDSKQGCQLSKRLNVACLLQCSRNHSYVDKT